MKRPYMPSKPKQGLWTSTHEDPENWLAWCLSEEFRCNSGQVQGASYLLEVKPSAKVYEIDTLEDLIGLVQQFPDTGEDMAGLRRLGSFAVDWGAAGEVYDGINLTGGGQWATRMPIYNIMDPLTPFDEKTVDSLREAPNLYGWDCESTLWFRWCFDKVGKL